MGIKRRVVDERLCFEIPRQNWVLHMKENTSDKIYIVTISNSIRKKYEVECYYGRNRKPEGREIDDLTYTHKNQHNVFGNAYTAALKIVDKQISKGYEDITHPGYGGDLVIDDVDDYLVSQDDNADKPGNPNKLSTRAVKAVKTKEPVDIEEYVVRCLDNVGIEKDFDSDEEYLAEKSDEKGFVLVENRFGKKILTFKNRFKKVKG